MELWSWFRNVNLQWNGSKHWSDTTGFFAILDNLKSAALSMTMLISTYVVSMLIHIYKNCKTKSKIWGLFPNGNKPDIITNIVTIGHAYGPDRRGGCGRYVVSIVMHIYKNYHCLNSEETTQRRRKATWEQAFRVKKLVGLLPQLELLADWVTCQVHDNLFKLAHAESISMHIASLMQGHTDCKVSR